MTRPRAADPCSALGAPIVITGGGTCWWREHAFSGSTLNRPTGPPPQAVGVDPTVRPQKVTPDRRWVVAPRPSGKWSWEARRVVLARLLHQPGPEVPHWQDRRPRSLVGGRNRVPPRTESGRAAGHPQGPPIVGPPTLPADEEFSMDGLGQADPATAGSPLSGVRGRVGSRKARICPGASPSRIPGPRRFHKKAGQAPWLCRCSSTTKITNELPVHGPYIDEARGLPPGAYCPIRDRRTREGSELLGPTSK